MHIKHHIEHLIPDGEQEQVLLGRRDGRHREESWGCPVSLGGYVPICGTRRGWIKGAYSNLGQSDSALVRSL